MSKTPDQILADMAETYKERSKSYGNNYLKLGKIMEAFFPDGLELKTAEEWNRFHLWLMSLIKLTRLAESRFNHIDSAHDNAVYSAMLESLIDLKPIEPTMTRVAVNEPYFYINKSPVIFHGEFLTCSKILTLSDRLYKDPVIKFRKLGESDYTTLHEEQEIKAEGGMHVEIRERGRSANPVAPQTPERRSANPEGDCE